MKAERPFRKFSYRGGQKQLTGRYIASLLKAKKNRQRCGSPRLVQDVPRQHAAQVLVQRFQVEVRQVVPAVRPLGLGPLGGFPAPEVPLQDTPQPPVVRAADVEVQQLVPEVRPLGFVDNGCQLDPSGEFPAFEVPRPPRPARPQPTVVHTAPHSFHPHVEEDQVNSFCPPLESADKKPQPDPHGVGLESGVPPQLPEGAAFLPPRTEVAAPDQHKVFQQSLEAAASQEASDWSVVLEDLEKYNML